MDKRFEKEIRNLRQSKVEKPKAVHREISQTPNPIEKVAIYNFGKIIQPIVEFLRGRHWANAQFKLGLLEAGAIDKVPESRKLEFRKKISAVIKTASSFEKDASDLNEAIAELEAFGKETGLWNNEPKTEQPEQIME